MDLWRGLKVPGDTLPTRGVVVVDCHPDLEWTTVAVATDGPDGRILGLVDRHEGTSWAPASVAHLVKALEVPLVPTGQVDAKGKPKTTAGVALTPSAHHLSDALTKLAVDHHKLTPGELGAGCVALQQMIADGEAAHVGQPTLDIAARNSATRYLQGGEVQVWDRRQNRKTDISPLVAYSVAAARFRAVVSAQPKVVAPPVRARRTPAAPATVRRPAPAKRPSPTRRPSSSGGGGFDARSSGF